VIGWLDLSSGVSGDMLLGALVGAGVPLALMQAEIDRFELGIELTVESVRRAGLAATRVHVLTSELRPPRRTLPDVQVLLDRLTPPVAERAHRTFAALAEAEAEVHGIPVDEVHFHEVGALDALADVAGACTGLAALGLEQLVAGPLAVGGGTVRTEHGVLPVPGPAVTALLAGAGGVLVSDGDVELATPTGTALTVTQVTGYGPLPAMRLQAAGTGAGARDRSGRPNVVRLLLGEPVEGAAPGAPTHTVLEANVDDLDPRAWPHVLATLIEAGADDAWLTPILMKKGRPAHTVHTLVVRERSEILRDVLFRETSTLGVRETPTYKTALERTFVDVLVGGQRVAVKLGLDGDGSVVNAMPEWEHVVAAAEALGRPVTEVLNAALAAYARDRD
jgi:pyridinium-3,5-bisthiocarboxylic acid mononucleotide nickel chelatase